MRRSTLAVLAFLVAGCSASPASDDPADAPGADALVFLLGDDPLQRTTTAAPQWATGEWWRYHVETITGVSYDVTRVVAGRDGDNYTVGMPLEDWAELGDMVIGYHLPGYGDVRVSDLMYEVHDLPYKLLDFPLEAGKTWEAGFEFSEITVTVESATTSDAVIRVEKLYQQPWSKPLQPVTSKVVGDPYTARAEYDAALGEFRLLDIMGYARVEVVGHGFGHEGVVRVPRNQGIAFVDGVIGVAGTGTNGGGDPTTGQVEVPPTWDGMSLVLAAGALGYDGQGTTGSYREVAIAPNGTRYEYSKGPLDGHFDFKHLSVGPPGGLWRFEHYAVGPGLAQSEGFAYEVHDVDIPSMQVTRPTRA